VADARGTPQSLEQLAASRRLHDLAEEVRRALGDGARTP
jgi:hypothetical protein